MTFLFVLWMLAVITTISYALAHESWKWWAAAFGVLFLTAWFLSQGAAR